MDPLVRQAKKAFASSRTKEIESLLAEESRWQRKLTIATNKLDKARKKIDAALQRLARELDGEKPEESKTPTP